MIEGEAMHDSCLLCGSETTLIHAKQADYQYCPACEFISKDARFLLTPVQERQEYDLHQNSLEDPRYVAYFNRFLDSAVFPFVQKGREALDFGSGPTPVLSQLLERDHGFTVDIYDLYYAQKKSYLGKTYDLITCTEVLEHLNNPLEYFRLFKKLLKPNGILSVMTQLHHNDASHFLRWHYIQEASHISFYSNVTLGFLAKEAGFEMLYSDGIRYTAFSNR